MSIERLKAMKETFMCAVEGQMYNLADVDAEELGEVVDMVKDLSEAIYYCEVTKAMEESEKNGSKEMMYYHMPNDHYNMNNRENYRNYHDGMINYDGTMNYDTNRSYYNGNNSNSSSGNSSAHYTEREFPHAFNDAREGKSYRSRRMYMEAKETKQDKTSQMRELEKYVQELTQDMIEMVEGSSPEEKQYLSKKMTVLANKIAQLND